MRKTSVEAAHNLEVKCPSPITYCFERTGAMHVSHEVNTCSLQDLMFTLASRHGRVNVITV